MIRIPDNDTPLWVFGYGSLMWNPGFEYERRYVARVYGLHRRLCVSSIRYRGTPEQPGLVLGLDRGGSCLGYAFEVHPDNKYAVTDYLEEREMLNAVYEPVFVSVSLQHGESASALTFRVRRGHPQYTGPMHERAVADRIRHCRGAGGANLDYLLNTLETLRSMGFDDPGLRRVARHLQEPVRE